jgi:hypothetical protein
MLGDAAGGQRGAQGGSQPDSVLGKPEPGGHHGPRVVVDEGEKVRFAAVDDPGGLL